MIYKTAKPIFKITFQVIIYADEKPTFLKGFGSKG